MLTPLAEILGYLSCTFLLGLTLGWLLWKYGTTEDSSSEIVFWKQRLEHTRIERDDSKDKTAAAIKEIKALRQQLEDALALTENA